MCPAGCTRLFELLISFMSIINDDDMVKNQPEKL